MVSLVQHRETKKVYVKKILTVYNADIYGHLFRHPIEGIPAIAAFYEENGHLTVLEEYISGTSLAEYMQYSLSTETVFRIMLDLCSILKRLHSFDPPIIHRDIKPSNIIITACDKLILLDFNAAKFFSRDEESDTVLLGTKGYAAPEQYGFGASTPQTDIYAAGVLLKELVCSGCRTPSETVSVFQPIIEKCTRLDPENRFPSAAALEEALLQLQKELLRHPGKRNKAAVRYVPMSADSGTSAAASQFHRYLPPGFRTLTPRNMLIGAIGYLAVFYFGITLTVEGGDGSRGWILANRIFFIAACLSVVLISCNYLDIQNHLPLCRHKNRLISFIGTLLFDTLTVLILLVLLTIVSYMFFPA